MPSLTSHGKHMHLLMAVCFEESFISLPTFRSSLNTLIFDISSCILYKYIMCRLEKIVSNPRNFIQVDLVFLKNSRLNSSQVNDVCSGNSAIDFFALFVPLTRSLFQIAVDPIQVHRRFWNTRLSETYNVWSQLSWILRYKFVRIFILKCFTLSLSVICHGSRVPLTRPNAVVSSNTVSFVYSSNGFLYFFSVPSAR